MADTTIDPVDAALNQLGHDFVPGGQEEAEEPSGAPVDETSSEEPTSSQKAAGERVERLRYEQEMTRIAQERSDLNVAKEHIDFVREVQTNQALKDHIRKFYQEPQAPARAASQQPEPVPDLMETMDPDDKKYVQLIMDRVLAEVRREIRPLHEVAGSLVQERQEQSGKAEMVQLNEQFPDWKEHVDPKSLAEAKAHRPELPVASLYRILAYDKVYAERSRSRKVLEEKLGRTAAPEAGGKPRQELRPKALNKDDAFDAALKQFPLLTSGRR